MPRMKFWQKLFLFTCLPAGVWTPMFAMAATSAPAAASSIHNSALDAQLFYEILLGELYARAGENGTGYTIMLDAAKRANDTGLFERSVGLALASRSGEAALQAARTWKREQPDALDADRYLLQILVALNRTEEAGKTLQQWLRRLPMAEQPVAIASIPRLFERVGDKKLALETVKSALEPALSQHPTRAAALTTLGRMQRDSGQVTQAVKTARAAHDEDPKAIGPLVLAVSLLPYARDELKPLLDTAMQSDVPPAEVRMSYARMLISQQAPQEALSQLQLCKQKFPAYAPAWLVSGLLQAETGQVASAQTSLQHFLEMTKDDDSEATQSGRSDALMTLSSMAQSTGNLAQADAWLQQIPGIADPIKVASQRAALMMRQGRASEAQQLLEQIAPQSEQQTIDKALVLSRWWRERKLPQQAYNVMTQALASFPGQTDLMSEMAIVDDVLERHDDMEQLLRQLMQKLPEDPQAYNMLGYSLADRNIRLPEAFPLIQKAVQLAPQDPFIQDSLGWVHFRLGNAQQALQILQTAYTQKPDAEIAAHLGEVLWTMGDKDRASRIWREGLLLAPDNATLRKTMQRLGFQP